MALDLTRVHRDPYAADRPPLAVDRERVIHAAAFRRLQHKTQVFVSQQGDHFRSRLTHTLEVASLARRIALHAGADAELAEVVALAHDLGHPPFGHAGERALHDALVPYGLTFEHNAHSLRVVTTLEHPYPEFLGLNLTAAVRACLATHTTLYDHPDSTLLGVDVPAAGEVVARADELAYVAHDLADGLFARLLDPATLDALVLWREAYVGPARATHADLLRAARPTIERLQGLLIGDLAWQASEEGAGAARVLRLTARQRDFEELTGLLKSAVYGSPLVVRMDVKAGRVVAGLFGQYAAEPRLLPRRWSGRVAEQGAARVVTDYIAGMTDRFARDEYARLFDPGVFD